MKDRKIITNIIFKNNKLINNRKAERSERPTAQSESNKVLEDFQDPSNSLGKSPLAAPRAGMNNNNNRMGQTQKNVI